MRQRSIRKHALVASGIHPTTTERCVDGNLMTRQTRTEILQFVRNDGKFRGVLGGMF